MLVVITIIGLMIGAIVLAVGVTGRDHTLEDETDRLANRLAAARERAEIESRPYGLLAERQSYRFLSWDADRLDWVAIDDDLLSTRALPRGIELHLRLDGREVVLPASTRAPLTPQLGVGADGEFSTFELRLQRANDAHAETVTPDTEGHLRRATANEGGATP